MLESISILYVKEYFFRFVRMTPQRFEHLLSLVGPHLQRTTTKMREPISPAERLVLTLIFLASGDFQQSLCFSFRISRAAICTILSETCEKPLGSFIIILCSCPKYSFRVEENQQRIFRYVGYAPLHRCNRW